MKYRYIFFSILFFSPLCQAEVKYRYPTDLSETERFNLMQSQGKYSDCLDKESAAVMDEYEDFRQIADVAMEKCKITLAEIDKDLKKMNLDPDFRRFFLRKTSQNSVKRLLPDLMMEKSK